MMHAHTLLPEIATSDMRMDAGTFDELLLITVKPTMSFLHKHKTVNDNPGPEVRWVSPVRTFLHSICLCCRKPARVADLVSDKLLKSQHVEIQFIKDQVCNLKCCGLEK